MLLLSPRERGVGGRERQRVKCSKWKGGKRRVMDHGHSGRSYELSLWNKNEISGTMHDFACIRHLLLSASRALSVSMCVGLRLYM